MAGVEGTVARTNATNTPAIVSASTALAANPARASWQIQNLGTNTLFVNLGGTASTTVFHFVLKGGTGNDDGLGASFSQQDGIIHAGEITIAGSTPRYTVLEQTS